MMNVLSNVAAVIPVFNPEPGLMALVDKLLCAYQTVVVVDDGSLEDVGAFDLLPAGVEVLRHERNMGKGRAIKTAIAHLFAKHPEVDSAVFVDGDGQHAPEDVANVVAESLRSGNVVLGVRDFSSAGIPFRSRFGNVWTSFLVRLIYRFPIRDTQTGLRAIPRRLFSEMLAIEGDRYEYEMRLFGAMKALDEKIGQVPIKTIYIAGNRTSHFNPIKDSIRVYRGLLGGRFLKFCVSAVLSFAVDNGVFIFLFRMLSLGGLQREAAISSALVVARVISALANYYGNRKLVFSSNSRVGLSLVKYSLLAVFVMALSCLGTTLISAIWDVDGYAVAAVKILVDLVLFVVSYQAQKRWVFKSLRALFLAVLLLPFSLFAGKHHAWLNFAAEHSIDRFSFSLEEQFVFEEDVFAPETLLMFGYKVSDFFSFRLGHRFFLEGGYGETLHSTEHRPTLELHFSLPEFMTLKIDSRTRFELRDKVSQQPYMRYRERIRLRTSWNATSFKISPYIQGEIFFSDKPDADGADVYDRNRLQTGFSFVPFPSIPALSSRLYYMLQHDLEDEWRSSNIYGLEFSYSF